VIGRKQKSEKAGSVLKSFSSWAKESFQPTTNAPIERHSSIGADSGLNNDGFRKGLPIAGGHHISLPMPLV